MHPYQLSKQKKKPSLLQAHPSQSQLLQARLHKSQLHKSQVHKSQLRKSQQLRAANSRHVRQPLSWMNLLSKLKKKMTLAPTRKPTGLRASPALHCALDKLAEKLADNGKIVAYEFDRLHRSNEAEWAALELSAAAANPGLNRYINVVPFDENRVKLQHGPNDYINASLLSSKSSSPNQWSYIATQGPLRQTAAAFWQMVWEQRAAVIVMLTRVTEKQAEKCAQYFPLRLGEEAVYESSGGAVRVNVTAVKDLDADICMRHLTVAHSSAEAPMVVAHYHYHR